jgi:hypothetical protein
MGQNPLPSFVLGSDGCSSVSGRQNPDFQKNSASIDKNDRVGSLLVGYFDGTAISVSPFFRIFVRR